MTSAERVHPSHFFTDSTFNRDCVMLYPGQYFAATQFTNENALVPVTILGSCVSCVLFDQQSGVYGLNHFLLPEDADSSLLSRSSRYGVHAMELLINMMLKIGATRSQIQAKAFGGASVLNSISTDIGKRNSKFLLHFLRIESIPLVSFDLGGSSTRKLYFFPETSEVKIRKLYATEDANVRDREARHWSISSGPASMSDIEFFE